MRKPYGLFAGLALAIVAVASTSDLRGAQQQVVGSTISGNLVYLDGAAHLRRWLAAIGPDVTQFLQDFVAGPSTDAGFDAATEWTITRVEAGAGESTLTKTDGVGGVLLLTNDANDNDGVNIQLFGESFKLTAGNRLYFGIRASISEATQSDFFFGLAITDTDILGGVTDRIGFEKLDGATAIKGMLEKDSTETLSASLATANTSLHTYEFYLDADGTVEFFIDGVSVSKPTTLSNLPNDEELRVTVQFLNGDGNSRTAQIDWIRVIQIGGRQ